MDGKGGGGIVLRDYVTLWLYPQLGGRELLTWLLRGLENRANMILKPTGKVKCS